jgi:hypothetical protein
VWHRSSGSSSSRGVGRRGERSRTDSVSSEPRLATGDSSSRRLRARERYADEPTAVLRYGLLDGSRCEWRGRRYSTVCARSVGRSVSFRSRLLHVRQRVPNSCCLPPKPRRLSSTQTIYRQTVPLAGNEKRKSPMLLSRVDSSGSIRICICSHTDARTHTREH